MVHVLDDVGEYFTSRLGFTLQVSHNISLPFRRNYINRDGFLLSKPPASADSLIPLLERMGWKKSLVVANLQIEAESKNRGLTYEDSLA